MLNILIIEDDKEQYFIYQRVLRGHELTFTSTVEETINALKGMHKNKAIPDLIISDANLDKSKNGDDGKEIMNAIQKLGIHERAKVIGISASSYFTWEGTIAHGYIIKGNNFIERISTVANEVDQEKSVREASENSTLR